MRTTIELPDKLLSRAKNRAAREGISLKDLFISALEQKLTPPAVRVRRAPSPISTGGPPIPDFTAQQIEDALFGSLDDAQLGGR